ncbi:transcriptional regulator [Opitutaceae bacterium TAV1]|nr:transcriptional regulator [Opitutaceae bacterium TAV1]
MAQNDPIQSISRAVRILFAVAGAEGGRSIEQIAETTGLNPSTAYRLIRTLENDKMLVRSTRPLRFLLGEAVGELKRLDDERHLIAVAGRVLVSWQAKLPEANFGLVERIGLESCERVRVSAARPGAMIIRRTKLHEPYGKVSPMLFLAYAAPDEQEEFFRRHPFEPAGRKLWGDLTKLHGFLADTCRRGYALPEFPEAKWFRVSVPIFAKGGHLVAAVGGYVEKGARQAVKTRLVKYCQDAATEISGKLRDNE